MALERMVRFIVYDRLDQFKCEILPDEVMDVVSKEAVNGEHSLTITTTQELDKTDRIVVRDGMGLWHEYVVLGITASHDTAGVTVKEYYCPWSLQYDLSATYIDTNVGLVPGHASVPHSARDALTAALSGTDRWTIGTVGVTTMASASFYRRSGWEGMDTVLEVWGGELAVTIGVGAAGVTSRQVSLLPHVGTSTATRRFDYAGDLTSIQRIVSDEVWPCRIVPLGRSTETSAGGYTRRPTISSVNQGVPWIQDDEAVPYTRIPNGQGGWEYPTLVVKNDTYSDPAALKAWAIEHVSEYTRPQVCYKAEVAQFVKAGLNAHGVALGDNVVVVDREFDSAGLRIDARVLEIQQDLLDSTRMKLTIGNMEGSLAQQFGSLARSVTSITSHFENMGEYQSTATYLSELLASINEVANALGGYAYYTEGQGIRTYDVPVTDPLVGSEATKVVEIKGGTIRIADSRTSGGDWDWRTVFVAGHIAAELVTAAQITAGYIGSAESGNYWDLDSGTMVLSADLNLGGLNNQNGILRVYDASGTLIGKWDNTGLDATGKLTLKDVYVYTPSSTREYIYTGVASIDRSNCYQINEQYATENNFGLAIRSTDSYRIGYNTGVNRSSVQIYPAMTPSTTSHNIIFAGGPLEIQAQDWNKSDDGEMNPNRKASRVVLNGDGFFFTRSNLQGIYPGGLSSDNIMMQVTGTSVSNAYLQCQNGRVLGNFYANGTKSRLVDTEHYADRLLYCDETPSPTFTDFGSGRTDEDGLCYVEVDDVFTETVRTNMAYQVFLQACGRGELWVEEKHPSYFVVHGTPNLAFDWQLKAHQKGYEFDRMEVQSMQMMADEDVALTSIDPIGELYSDELLYAKKMEALYETETTK